MLTPPCTAHTLPPTKLPTALALHPSASIASDEDLLPGWAIFRFHHALYLTPQKFHLESKHRLRCYFTGNSFSAISKVFSTCADNSIFDFIHLKLRASLNMNLDKGLPCKARKAFRLEKTE
jgi:hypothetical protein